MSDRTLFRIAVVITVAPIVVAAVRNGIGGWYPANDAALTAVYVKDVFSAHTPLIGLPARNSFGPAPDYFYPGAVEFYLLAVPVRLFGVSWGLLAGMAVLNSAWVVMALWLVRRRVGYRVGIVVCAAFATLLWGLGSQVLLDPTPVQAGSLAFLALCVAAWSVADGDRKALVPLALAGNFLVLTHLKFVLAVPVIGVAALVMWTVGVVRVRGRERDPDAPGRRAPLRSLAVAVGISVALWIPSVLQQLSSSHGNLSALIAAEGSGDDVARHLIDTVRVTATPIVTWPLWFRDSLAHPGFASLGPTSSAAAQLIGAIVVAGIALAVGLHAWKRRDTTVVTALGMGAVAWVAWVISTQVDPVTTPYDRTYLQVLWPLALFIWVALGIGVIRSVPIARLRQAGTATSVVPPAALAAVVAFGVLNLPAYDAGATTARHEVPIARKVHDAVVAKVHGPGPVLVRSQAYPARSYFPVVLLSLQDQGIAFRVTPGWDTTIYGSFRRFRAHPPNARRELVVTNASTTLPGARPIVVIPRTTTLSHTKFARIATAVTSMLATTASVRLPRDVDATPESREAFDGFMDWVLVAAHTSATQRQVLALLAHAVKLLPAGSQESAFRTPGVDDSSMRRWLHDLVAQPTTVYVRPIPSR